MGRASRIKADFKGETRALPGISKEITHQEVGSAQHLERLRLYAAARYAEEGRGEAKITVRFENFCANCSHRLEDHLLDSAYCQFESPESCGCTSYYPGGSSRTDMQGNIIVQSDLPPGGEPWQRQVCIFGLLRHEMCHELYTDRIEHQRLATFIKSLDDPYSPQLYKCFNILEDGRIENIDKTLNPQSYRYIEGLNALHPRVALPENDLYTQSQEKGYSAPEGYTAFDADGNPLTSRAEEINSLTGERVFRITVPAGTRLSTWGEAPVSLPAQMRAALLASAVPGFRVGKMHPLVQETLSECAPYIKAASSSASTKECIESSKSVFNILKERNLLFPPEEDEDPRSGIGSQEGIDDLRKEIEDAMEADRLAASQQAQERREQQKLRSEDIEMGAGESGFSQEELEKHSYSPESATLQGEGELKSLGEDLASQLRLIRSQEDVLLSGQTRGHLDLRRLPQAVAGSTHVHTVRDIPSRPSVEVSVVIDRSGSTAPDIDDQYRMAVMCSHAAQMADVPVGIYGYSKSEDVEHYTYKEPDSSNLASLGAIFKTGNGSTPTAESIHFQAKKLSLRRAQKKIIVVVTDGAPDNLDRAALAVRDAKNQGLEVVGVGFRFQEEGNMNTIFGENKWRNIADYSQVPTIVSKLIANALGAH